MGYDIKAIQLALNAKGYGPLLVDGESGPKTSAAIRSFKRRGGLRDTDFVGPITFAKLTGLSEPIKAKIESAFTPPWHAELAKMIGKHESANNAEVAAWLKSDGNTVGDPAKIPWCGDAIQTAISLSLPDEKLPSNPYAAISWASFGKFVEPQRGCILSFWRGLPDSWKGHVGFYAGESHNDFYVLGANQSDSVNIMPIAKSRLRKQGSRWPLTGVAPSGSKVIMSGGTRSTDEA